MISYVRSDITWLKLKTENSLRRRLECPGDDPVRDEAPDTIRVRADFLLALTRGCRPRDPVPDLVDEDPILLGGMRGGLHAGRFQRDVVGHERRSLLQLIEPPHALQCQRQHFAKRGCRGIRGGGVRLARKIEAPRQGALEKLVVGLLAHEPAGLAALELAAAQDDRSKSVALRALQGRRAGDSGFGKTL